MRRLQARARASRHLAVVAVAAALLGVPAGLTGEIPSAASADLAAVVYLGDPSVPGDVTSASDGHARPLADGDRHSGRAR